MRLRRFAIPALFRGYFSSRAIYPPYIDKSHHAYLSMRRLLSIAGLLLLLLFTAIIAPWPIVQPPIALAASFHQPKLLPPAWLKAPTPHQPPDLGHNVTAKPGAARIVIPHSWPVSMPPLSATITPETNAQPQRLLGKDGHLEVDLPAHLLSHATLAKAGGAVSLQMTQLLPGSGGLSSNLVFFGTYLFQFLDAHGHPLAQVPLAHPLILRYHMTTQQTALIVRGQQVYTLWRPGGSGDWLAADASRATLTDSKIVPHLDYATPDQTGRVWSIISSLSARSQRQLALSPSTLTFGTQAPQAVWVKPQDVAVDLNAGGLTYGYPLALPPGPGGFTPDLSLSYTSAAVNENHNVQAAAPEVGEGWNISLGSISWAEENVTPGGTNRLENVWTINDANGISGQLIPPDLKTSTIPPYNPAMSSLSQSSPYLWHTAPESHAKVEEMNFGNQPCWRVWLPNGVIEDFGCTNDSRQSYVDSQSNVVQWRWDLDLLIDPHGNQVHIQYQQNHPSDGYVRDAVISSISYDDPGCLNTTSSCSPWNPQVTLTFDSSNVVANLTNSSGGCANWSNSQGYRCDDPVDLSGSGGLPIPKVIATYVLNDLKVTVNGNLLREYVFSYEQTPPQTITDPSTGQQESVAGYLDLTQIQALGVNGDSPSGAAAPTVTMSYLTRTQHYEDTYQLATPPTNCQGWFPINSSGQCLLWSRSYSARYLQNLDNGQGWNETIAWEEARNNTRGVDSGAVNNPTTCDGHESSTNLCGMADDQSWSRIVVQSRAAVSNGVTSTWSYSDYLQQNIRSNFPGACFDGLSCYQGFTWGNQNDDDWLDYYNGQFEGFAQVEVTQPDKSYQVYTYAATNGWGLADGVTCYLPPGQSCSVADYFAGYSANGQTIYATTLAGNPISEDEYDTDGDLLQAQTWNYALNCPPPGVSHSLNSGGTKSDPGGTQLISQLDTNNPVVVCDPRATQENDYTLDGVTTNLNDPRVVHTTTSYSYDTENKSGTSGYDYGNLSLTTESGNDVGGAQLLAMQQYDPNDNIPHSHYLTDLPALSQQQDGNSTPWSCSQSVYGSNTGYNASPTVPDVTQAQSYSVAGSGGCTGTNNLITVQHTYDASGNALTAIDGDGHLGCTENGNQYSACAVYDSADTHILTATNALKQATTYTYATDATGGFGEWLTAETDPNSQTTQYQYDVLGRLTAIARPGDSLGSPTVSYTYTNGCSQGETTPCLELDTSTQYVSGGPTSTVKQWYDGWGNLVEAQTPAPSAGQTIVTYTIYDNMNRPIVQSLPYAIDTPSGYVTPDQTQPRTVTSYDGLGRSLGTITYGQGNTIVTENTISYTIGNSIPTRGGDTNPYEQTITVDALNHQSITYTDAFGRTAYTQVFSGTSSYSVVRTVGYSYDPLGDAIETVTYDHTGTSQAVSTATYDALKERTGFTDPDLGTWTETYDADGNLTQQAQIVNGQAAATTTTSYDALDRPLCQWNSVPPAQGNCQQNGNAIYFYDSYDNTSNPTMTFPSGCSAPTGSYASDPIGHATAEVFNNGKTNGSGWYCYGYDQRGETDQKTLSVTTPDNQTLTQTVNMSYDDGGELTTLVYPNGEALTAQYDANGRAQSVYFGTPSTPDPVNFLVGQVNYTPWGQIAGLAMGGSGPKASSPTNTLYSTSLSYDAIQRPLSTSATMSGQTQAFFSQTRTYDAIGNVIQLLTTIPTSSGGTKNDNQSYCYDDLSRLMWNGNNGTPTGGDDCGPAPTGTTIAYHHQAYSYDDLDRMTSGREGTYTYGDSSSIHAVTNLSDVPNQYAAYDAFGEMICQNTDTTSAHTCSGSSPTGAIMQYDPLSQLLQWTAPSGTTASDSFLYDGEGNRVLQSASSTVNGTTTVTDTITFDGYTESTITGGTTTTMNYYSLGGQRLALQQGSNPVTYLISDLLGSVDVAVNAGGTIAAVQLYWPYGAGEYSWGTMPTTYNFTGQRLDSVTGLLYYNARYYDPFSARFTSADTVENNASGMDPYAYVGDDPVTLTDPSGEYYSNGTQLGESGGETAYVYNDEVVTVTNDGRGIFYPLSGPASWNYGSLYVNVSTSEQFNKYGSYNSANDPQYSTAAKFGAVTGWTQLQQRWNAPNANWQSRLGAIGQFAGTNANNVLQLAMIFSGGEDDGVAVGADEALTMLDKVTLYRAVGETELNDILRYGDYGLSPSGGGKYFSFTEEGARQFANSSINVGKRMTITSVEVPASILEQGFKFFDPGGGNESIHFDDDSLLNLYEIMDLPEIIDAPWVPII